MRGSIALLVLGLGLLGMDLVAQEKAGPNIPPKIPSYGLEISTEEPVAAQLPSQTYETGFACNGDGSVVVNSVPPLNKSKRRGAWILNTISPRAKVVNFVFKKIRHIAIRDTQ